MKSATKVPGNKGVPIVLTASTIEMSDFNLNPFIAFSGGFPKFLVRKKLYPPVPFNQDGTAKFAPYGLRKVESLLIEEFGEENVVTVYPTNLHRFIGPKTKIVEEIAPILVEKSLWRCNGKRCASIEVGIETGSVRLMEKYMKGKMLPYKPEQWQGIVDQSLGILNDNNIYPLATLILGLPGEQEEDILATITLLDRLKGAKILYVPLLFTSEEESTLKRQKHKDLKNLDELHWDILARCGRYDINTWKPEINKIVMVGSLLSYPYYRWRHGKKIFKVIMKFSGLEAIFLNKKLECQPKYCTHLKNHKLQASNSK